MSSHSFYDRSHFSASASSSNQRQNSSSTPRPTSYSSLNEALGTDRPPDPAFPHQFRPPDTPTAPMSSDSRYVYQQHPQGMAPYEYPTYAQSAYAQPPFPPNPSRPPPRAAPTQSPSPTQQGSYNPSQAQAPYHPHPHPHPHQPHQYGSAQFAPVTPSTSQWTGEGWSTTQQYSQFAPPVQEQQQQQQQQPPPPALEPQQSRPEPGPAHAPAAAQRAYAPAPPSTEPHRIPEPAPTVEPPPPPPTTMAKRKQREQPEPPARVPSPPSSGLDFHKLLESYRVIIDTTRSLANDPATAHGRPPPADALQRMLHSANYGWQVLSAAAGPQPMEGPPAPPPVPGPPPAPPSSAPPTSSGGDEGEGAALKRQKSEGPVPEGQTCLGCNATSTPEWRRGPLGPRTLCNACGLVYAKLIKKRNREAAKGGARPRARSGSALPDDAGMQSSGEEDEDSYASQELRSEVGDHGGRG
ncbi:hypothetical protein DENSPDRAFT_834427 [Dentipellis sp. KUC8613]|nr:hypothetical protein DENSPDRAFT_834427 [Dentipellis sp. KUC8613]